ncbi:NADH-quinone oxidoreductase subunit H [Candidatus Uhrbacteria bacterium]|nr:NADH-quinone oxidoreductase subunit H [Candidatus Uhrbacteria bacterium]
MSSLLITVLQFLLVLGCAPFATGMVRWVKARMQGRAGASPLLPYYTLATLFRKEMVISPVTSWVFRVSPFVVLATALVVSAVLPLLSGGGMFAGNGDDFLFFAGILMLGSVFLVLGGLDPGSAFGGMGASREMTIATLIEPAVMVTLTAFAAASGTGSTSGMLAAGGGYLLAHPALLLSVLAFVFVLLAENARYPVDNPATHLELTMVHEAMVLEYSGPYLAMLEFASSIKLAVFAIFLGNLLVPQTLLPVGGGAESLVVAVLGMAAKLTIMMVLLALLESTIPKMRFYRMQEYSAMAFGIALAGLVLTILPNIV